MRQFLGRDFDAVEAGEFATPDSMPPAVEHAAALFARYALILAVTYLLDRVPSARVSTRRVKRRDDGSARCRDLKSQLAR
jgi:hypothetical protein